MKKKLIVMSLLISAFLMATDNEKGLTDEYDKLSKELSEQIELVTMYALNEW